MSPHPKPHVIRPINDTITHPSDEPTWQRILGGTLMGGLGGRRSDPARQRGDRSGGTAVSKALRALLDGAGIACRTGADQRGRERAWFTLVAATGEALACEAVLRGEMVQLVVRDVLPGSPDNDVLWALNEVNQDWYGGRVYYCPERDTFEIATGLHRARLDGAVLAAALAHLGDAVSSVRLGEPHFPPLPEAFGGDTMDDLARAVASAGFAMEARRDGRLLVGRFTDPDGRERFIELFKAARRFLCLRAHPPSARRVLDDGEALRKLQGVNAGLAAGAAAIARGEGRAFFTLAQVLDWIHLDGDLVRYLVEGGIAAVRVIEAELCSPP